MICCVVTVCTSSWPCTLLTSLYRSEHSDNTVWCWSRSAALSTCQVERALPQRRMGLGRSAIKSDCTTAKVGQELRESPSADGSSNNRALDEDCQCLSMPLHQRAHFGSRGLLLIERGQVFCADASEGRTWLRGRTGGADYLGHEFTGSVDLGLHQDAVQFPLRRYRWL